VAILLLHQLILVVCSAGLLRAVVLTNGDVITCEMPRNLVMGNIWRESWSDIWRRSVAQRLGEGMEGGLCFHSNLRQVSHTTGM